MPLNLDGFGERSMLKKRPSSSVLWDHNDNNNNNNNSDSNKSPISKFLVASLLKVIYWNCNTTQMFGFTGMFSKIIFSYFFFYFEPKSNWWLQLFFNFMNNDFNFLENLLMAIFRFDYIEFSIRTSFWRIYHTLSM